MTAPKLTNPEILSALRARYAPPEWAFLEQVRSRTGFEGAVRTADALAMNLFPGRGLELHGFEIKVHRGDVKRELAAPAKAEEIQRHCDRWWLVLGEASLIREGELPPTWGLLVPDPSPRAAGSLRMAVQAPPLHEGPAKTRPVERAFLAAILRNVADAKQGMVTRDEIAGLEDKAREAGRAQGRREGAEGVALGKAERDLAELKKTVETFESASGVRIDSWQAGEIGDAVRLVLACGLEQTIASIERSHEWLLREAKEFGQRIRHVRAEMKKVKARPACPACPAIPPSSLIGHACRLAAGHEEPCDFRAIERAAS